MHCHYNYSTHATQHMIYLRLFRIKLESGSTSVSEFYHGHPEMPFNSRPTSRYHIEDLIRILLQSDMADHKVCTRCKQERFFIVDVGRMNYQDLKADDLSLGSWPQTGTNKSYFYFATCHQSVMSLLVATTPISLMTNITDTKGKPCLYVGTL